jgi:hypothetical protein
MRQYVRPRLAARVMFLVVGMILLAVCLPGCSDKSSELVPGDERAAWEAVIGYFDANMPPADRTKMTKKAFRYSISNPGLAEIDLLLEFWLQGKRGAAEATVILLRDGAALAWKVVLVERLELVER